MSTKSNRLSFDDVRDRIEPDGSLRDVYVFDVATNEWQALFDIYASSIWPATLTIGDTQIADIRNAFSECQDVEIGKLLAINIDGALIHCHVYAGDEIEWDISPKEITARNFDYLQAFFESIAHRLDRNIYVVEEGGPQWGLFAYVSEDSSWRLLDRPDSNGPLLGDLKPDTMKLLNLFRQRPEPPTKYEDRLQAFVSDLYAPIPVSEDASPIVRRWIEMVFRPNDVRWHEELTDKTFEALYQLSWSVKRVCNQDYAIDPEKLNVNRDRRQFWESVRNTAFAIAPDLY